MRKINIHIVLICFLLSNIVFSQQQKVERFDLEWSAIKTIKLTEDKSVERSLVKGNYVDENLNPEFSKIWRLDSNESLANYSVENIKYEIVPSSYGNLLNRETLKNKFTVTFNISKERNETYAVLECVPIIIEGSQIKKVVSFDLVYEFAQRSLKVTKQSTVKNSVLATGEWFKFSVDTTGIFKLDKSFLQSLGLNLKDVNPRNIKIYGNGGAMLPFLNSDFRYDGLQENAIFIEGEEDGVFNDSDYVLFYATGPHKWIANSNSLNGMEHQLNIFSDKSYYFVTVSSDLGKRIQPSDEITEPATKTITTFEDYTFFEKDEVNLFAAGQQWFGDNLSVNNSKNYAIPFKNLENSQDVLVRVRGVAKSSLSSFMEVKVNGQNAFNVNFSAVSTGGLTKAYANRNEGLISLNGDVVNVEVNYNNNGNPSANAYLDYIEVIGVKKLLANDFQFSFRSFEVANSSGVYEFEIGNKSNIYNVWDVSNPIEPKKIEDIADSASFKFKVNGNIPNEFIVLNESDFYEPMREDNSAVKNQNLHSLTNLDYIIVTQEYLMNTAQRLADFHSENSGLITQVISLEEIYNEFSSGSPDLTAIRDFARHLYANSTSNQLKYICLFGDASYDYKDRISGNNNIVPVFEAYNSFNLASSYVTDDYYGMMDLNEGMLNSFERQDVATGRIPVTDINEANEVVDKILSYYGTESFGDWRTNITLIADDIDATGEQVIQVGMEKIADTIAKNKPLFNLNKIYCDAYVQESSSGGNKYPDVNLAINNQVEKGTLLIDYFGHGGENGWASEGILTVPDIQSWKNAEKLPLFITVTCEFSRFDNPLRKSAGEYVIWNANGGAASTISTTREIFISVGQAFNENLIRPLLNFESENYTIAETLMQVKNQFSTSQRFFIYSFGDPAMRLHVPNPSVKISKMNDNPVSTSLDTIKALSYVKFEGEVVNENGELLTNFNGEFDVTVYDKAITKSTLDNDNKNFVMEFDAIESKIFTGRSKVENGIFNFDFVAPKDLKIAFGKGKLSLYAQNLITDKAGYNFDVVVGGINENAPEDNTGPIIQLYMNDLSFVDGGNTNESPIFIAVLEDENGINTSITAVDHDIVAYLDGDRANPIILNDYYETELDNYKKGQVKYPFRDLSPGLHTITLKVWDTYNNPSEATFTFFVVDDRDLVLTNVLNYPNPFVSHTEFWFNHNKPNQLLNVQVQIFTVSGKLVKTINQVVQSEGNLSRSITWDGLDDFGAKIGKGVYVYKLKVSTAESNIKAEKIEKLVILQ